MNLTLLVTGPVIVAFRTGDLVSHSLMLLDIFPTSLAFFSLDYCFSNISTDAFWSFAIFFFNSLANVVHIFPASFSILLQTFLAFFKFLTA